MWQLVGPIGSKVDWKEAILRRGSLLIPGPGAHIEFIGPRYPAYNWEQGSRAIEARREAGRMRSKAYGRWRYEVYKSRLAIATMLMQLGIDPGATSDGI